MTDLNNHEVPVASNPNVPVYMSTWPSWCFGLIGAAFQSRNAKKRGLTDTRRYWKAAWISTGIGFLLSILLTILMTVVIVATLGNVAHTQGTETAAPVAVEPTASPTPVVDTSNTVVINGVPRKLPIQAPDATDNPVLMAKKLAQLRYQAFCTGGDKGIQMLDQVWASHDDPPPLAYTLENANNLEKLAPAEPLSTYALDVHTFEAAKTFTGSSCSYVFPGSLMSVPVSYSAGNKQRVVVSVFKDGEHIVGAYTAVYDLIDGHWYINQMH